MAVNKYAIKTLQVDEWVNVGITYDLHDEKAKVIAENNMEQPRTTPTSQLAVVVPGNAESKYEEENFKEEDGKPEGGSIGWKPCHGADVH